MRFSDNAELTPANMATTDILAGTDVSAGTDKKFTLSGLADWFLSKFTGLSLAGKNQSVKAALDELNSTVDKLTNSRVACTTTGSAAGSTLYVIRTGTVSVVQSDISIQSNGASAGEVIATGLPACSYNDQYGILAGASGVAYRVTATTDGKLKVVTAVPTGYYRISYVYVASMASLNA